MVGFEFDSFEVFDNTIGGGAISVPDGPPALIRFWEVGIGFWAGEEVAVVSGVGRRVVGE